MSLNVAPPSLSSAKPSIFRERFPAVLLGCSALISLALCSAAQAQVAITLGAQEIYDDNIFLENGERRPAPLVLNDAIEQDVSDGALSVFNVKQNDGNEDDDLISNVFISLSSDIPQVDKYGDASAEGKVGALFFADTEDQNRLTVDGTLNFALSDTILPRPYYLTANSSLRSESNDSGVAKGTATRATENLDNAVNIGISNYEVANRTLFSLGYTGTYHIYLGEFFLDDAKDTRFEESGTDYHTHTASSALDYQVSKDLLAGIGGSIGVQLFTDIENPTGDSAVKEDRPEDLDRTNAEINVHATYSITERWVANGRAGIGLSSFHEDRQPFSRTIVGADGMPVMVTVVPDEDETTFVFVADTNYVYQPGSAVSGGVTQNLVTDQNGDRVISRAVFANITQALGDRFSLTGAGNYVQFSNEDDLGDSTDRFEASVSASYSLTQNTALVVGYNYAHQDADDSQLDDLLSFQTGDYDTNRVFVSLNVGFLGLPL